MKLNRELLTACVIFIAAINITCSQTDMWNKTEERDANSGSYITLPVASIVIDGDSSDWSSVPVLINAETGTSLIPGTDIKCVKAAVDSTKQKMYVYMEMANGDLDSLYVYAFYFIQSGLNEQAYCRDGWVVYGNDDLNSVPITANGEVQVTGSYIEYSFDLSGFNLPQFFYISASVYDGSGGGDYDVAELDTLVTIPY